MLKNKPGAIKKFILVLLSTLLVWAFFIIIISLLDSYFGLLPGKQPYISGIKVLTDILL